MRGSARAQSLAQSKVARRPLPWVVCESLTAKVLRAQLIADHGANPKWMRAAGCRRRGAFAAHDAQND